MTPLPTLLLGEFFEGEAIFKVHQLRVRVKAANKKHCMDKQLAIHVAYVSNGTLQISFVYPSTCLKAECELALSPASRGGDTVTLLGLLALTKSLKVAEIQQLHGSCSTASGLMRSQNKLMRCCEFRI